ncbi:PREDICTED: uncharacterized protein LOC107102351 [Cyprinodon variegatus]|uniref:uncharacterized protein LOC107102351 n=1 Tax=Cyprinodon variegatus TaxID=28743 RepID=UPI0007428B3F|nr:PREDICTED: uncharacterized protein LOC107102351 [Cyprinodon variegatus]
MTNFVVALGVSLTAAEENYFRAQQYNMCATDLSKTQCSHPVKLWYKEGPSGGITRIQFSFTKGMEEGLRSTGFTKCEKNINTGTGGDPVYLWYLNGTEENHVPITDIEVSRKDEARKFTFGWEKLACNLNRGTGEAAFLWVKREQKTYIKSMQTTDHYENDEELFKNGFIRVDESTNRGVNGRPVFLWYLPSTTKDGNYTTLQVSTNKDEYQRYQNGGYSLVIPSVNLNSGNTGNEVFLWFKKEEANKNPISNMVLIYNQDRMTEYESVGVRVLQGNLNSGDGCPCFPATPLYLGYY